MREGWKETRLRDLCADISYGYTTSATDKVTGVKFLRITDVVPDFIDWSTVPYCEISPTNYEKTKLEVNDIVIARTGATVGYAKQIKKAVDAVNASYLVRLRLNDKAHKKYIGILVESDIFKSFVRTIAGGSAQPNANAKDLTSFKFLLPPLPLQTRIADLLSAYDELIEVNNRRIALLEQTAEQLYKEWFVRLRFPGYAQTKVRKGVPEGWDIKPLKFFGKIITGKTPSKKIESYFGGDIPFVKTPDMHGNVFVIETMETLTRSGAESQKKQTIPNGSIMVNCIGALSGSVSITSTNCQTNQQINSLVLKNWLYAKLCG